MGFLLCLKDPVNIFVHIIHGFDLHILSACEETGTPGSTYRRRQVENCLPSYESFFVIVFNFYINDMYSAIEFTPS
jgi:hypothetical protein